MKINTSSHTKDASGDLITTQLSLTLATRSPNRRRPRRKAARARAAYWFDRMHKVVNAAREWQPTPAARPQQTYINLPVTNA